MKASEFKEVLANLTNDKNIMHSAATSSAIARTHANAVANSKLYKTLEKLVESINDINNYVHWLHDQNEILQR